MMIKTVTLIVLIVLLIGIPLEAGLHKLDSLLIIGDYERARLALQSDPDLLTDPAWYHYYLGRISLSADSAAACYARALQSDPRFARADTALFLMSQFRYLQGYYQTAQKYLSQLISVYPNSKLIPQANFWLGRSCLSQKDYTASLTLFNRLIQFGANEGIDPGALSLARAEAYQGLGQYSQSFAVLKPLLDQSGSSIDRASVLARMENCVVLSQDPNLKRLYYQLGASPAAVVSSTPTGDSKIPDHSSNRPPASVAGKPAAVDSAITKGSSQSATGPENQNRTPSSPTGTVTLMVSEPYPVSGKPSSPSSGKSWSTSRQSSTTGTSLPTGFYCQVGSFSRQDNAERLKQMLEFERLPARIDTRQRDDYRTIHIVLVGPYPSRNQAVQAGEKLRKFEGMEYIIINR